ncbi:uncharacterized protein [Pleurodeles waltl]|uniref:uncharacterized protein n=1 Tax=Pleurodeles waltl TaxID=8319 RepID=UPI0037096926
MYKFLVLFMSMQPQSMVHPYVGAPTFTDSLHFFPTIQNRPVSFSPPPACPQMGGISQRRKSTSFLEAHARQQPLLRNCGQKINPHSSDVHPSFEPPPVFSNSLPGTESCRNSCEISYLIDRQYQEQFEHYDSFPYSSTSGLGQIPENQHFSQVSAYNRQTYGSAYLAQPIQSLHLDPSQSIASTPISSDSQVALHQILVPHSAPPVLATGTEGHPKCVFEFHVHTSSSPTVEGSSLLTQRIYKSRRGSVDFNQDDSSQTSSHHCRLQPVTEEQYHHSGIETSFSYRKPMASVYAESSSDYSSDYSQQTSSDPGDFLSPPPSGSAPSFGADMCLPYSQLPQAVFQDPQLVCYSQSVNAQQSLPLSYPVGGPAAYFQVISVHHLSSASPSLIFDH